MASVEEHTSIVFFCTNRGRHQRRYPRARFESAKVALNCSTCGRNTLLTYGRLADVLSHPALPEEVDISVLPF